MNEFFFVPFPLPEESPTSLLKRFAIKHGCVTSAQFHSLGAPFYDVRSLSSAGDIPAWIAKISGAYGNRFLSGFYSPVTKDGSKQHIITGVTVKNRMIRWSGIAFCSECWREGTEHFIKDLRVCMHCPLHNKTYLFTCPTCNVRLRWHSTLTPRCGACQNEIISPSCSPKEAEPEQVLLSWFRESKQEKMDCFERALRLLNYKPPVFGGDENRDTMIAAIGVVAGDTKVLEEYLCTLHSQYPHLERRMISAVLSLINTEASRSAALRFLQFDDQHQTLPPTPTLPPVRKQPFLLSRKQVRKLTGLPMTLWPLFVREQKSLWESIARGFPLPESLILQLLEKSEELKRRISTTDAEFKTMNIIQAAQRLELPLNTVKRLIREKLLGTTTLSDHRSLAIAKAQLRDFTDTYETLDHLASRINQHKRTIFAAMQILNIRPYFTRTFHYPTLLYRADTRRIIEHLETLKSHKNHTVQCRDQLKLMDDQNVDNYCICDEASKLSGLADGTIAVLIRHGWLTPHRRLNGGKMGIYLLKSEVIFAKHNFLKPGAYSKLIGTNPKIATELVMSLGVKPIAGPLLDCSATPIFLREDINNLIIINTSTSEESMTILEASRYLNLPAKTIISLLRTHDLSCSCEGRQSSLFISKTKAQEFSNTYVNAATISRWCGIPPTKILSFLERMSVAPIYEKYGATIETIYRVSDLTLIGINSPKPNSKKTYLSTLISTRDTCNKLQISAMALAKNFIKTGFITSIQVQGRQWISPADYSKLRTFLKKYCTVAMADARIGLKSYFKELLAKGEIRIANDLPPELAGKIILKRSDVSRHLKKYTAPHHSRRNLNHHP